MHHPGAGIISSAGPVDSTYEIDTQLADLEYRRLLAGDRRAWLNYSVGARYANLEQEFFQTGVFAGAQAGQIDTQTTADFDGAGVLFGLDGECRFGSRGFSFYGNTGISPVVGQFSTFYSMNNATADVLLANVLWKDDRFVTIFDFELGLGLDELLGQRADFDRVSRPVLVQHDHDAGVHRRGAGQQLLGRGRHALVRRGHDPPRVPLLSGRSTALRRPNYASGSKA